MNKYIIRENIEWEGYNQWTVFALSEDSAKTIVKMLGKGYLGEKLTIVSSKSAKGRKEEGIHKFTTKSHE